MMWLGRRRELAVGRFRIYRNDRLTSDKKQLTALYLRLPAEYAITCARTSLYAVKNDEGRCQAQVQMFRPTTPLVL